MFTMTAPSPNWQPKAIVFDLLTALLNSWDTWTLSTPSKTEQEGRRWRARYLEITFAAGAYTPATAYEQLVQDAARDVGLPASAPRTLLQGWAQLEPWPEAGQVLQVLRSRGFRLGVVTNCSVELGRIAVHNVEEHVGDGFSFDAVATAEESGYYKPVTAAYEAVLQHLDVKADEVLFVAGSAGDVQGATDAGMRVVWHNRVGLARKGEAVPLREGKSLQDALENFL